MTSRSRAPIWPGRSAAGFGTGRSGNLGGALLLDCLEGFP
jgi:hypothetical protein